MTPPWPARLALQLGLVFCIVAAALGLGAELSGPTLMLRALLAALAGAALGAGIAGFVQWMKRIADDVPVLAADAESTALAPVPEGPQEPGTGG